MNNNFALNLKKIRKEYNLSQEQLAEELGVSRQAISKWESASAYPEMDKIIALCDKFNLNIDDLLHKDIREVKGEAEQKKKINNYINDFLNFVTDTVNFFSSMSFKSKIKCLLEQIVIIFILVIVSLIVFSFSDFVLNSVFNFLPRNLHSIIDSILEAIVLLLLFIFSLVLLVHIFKIRYLDYYSILKKDTLENTNEKISLKKNESKIIIRNPNHEYKFMNVLFKFMIITIKFFMFWLVLFLSITLVFLFCGLPLAFLLYKTGLFFIGLIGSLISLGIINIICLLFILNFIFNRKTNKKILIWTSISSLISLGIFIGFILIGSMNFNVVSTNEFKTGTFEYQMKDNLFFSTYLDINYIESDIDNVKLEYEVLNLCDAEDSKYYENGIHIYASCSNMPRLIKEVINNLNNKKIIQINDEIRNIKVYASKENIEKLKNNSLNYRKR